MDGWSSAANLEVLCCSFSQISSLPIDNQDIKKEMEEKLGVSTDQNQTFQIFPFVRVKINVILLDKKAWNLNKVRFVCPHWFLRAILQEWKSPSERWRANQCAPHLRHWRHSGRQVGADTCSHPGWQAAGTTPVRGLQTQGTSASRDTYTVDLQVLLFGGGGVVVFLLACEIWTC